MANLGSPTLFKNNFFQIGWIRKFIEARGHLVDWEKAHYCPNRRSLEEHDINCSLCKGTGFLYIDKREIRALVTNPNMRHRYETSGMVEEGAVRITVLPENRVGEWDKFTIKDAVGRHEEIIKRSDVSAVDKIKYIVEEVVDLRDKDKQYVNGVDFVINFDGNIEWISDNKPYPGETYSIIYMRKPVYIVTEVPFYFRGSDVRNEGGTGFKYAELPVQVLARLDYLVEERS